MEHPLLLLTNVLAVDSMREKKEEDGSGASILLRRSIPFRIVSMDNARSVEWSVGRLFVLKTTSHVSGVCVQNKSTKVAML
jgi:hypothetical protein